MMAAYAASTLPMIDSRVGRYMVQGTTVDDCD